MLKTLYIRINQLSELQLKITLTLLAMLIAIQIQYIQHGWINPDTVLYLESAKLFAVGKWQEGFNIFKWPAYSILIAATHKITSISIHHSAQCLSVIFFGIATASFLKIIELAGGDKKTVIAGALILFSSTYLVGDVLGMLMRDQGFWAFFLTSLVFFIHFYRKNTLRDAVLWQITIISATLFRIEGISYLMLLPLLTLTNQNQKMIIRLSNFLKCNCINLCLAITAIALLYIFKTSSLDSLGRLNEVFTSSLLRDLTLNLYKKSAIMNSEVLGRYLNEYGTQALLLTLAYVMISKAFFATGAINSVLAAIALTSKRISINQDVSTILRGSAIISILNMSYIIIKSFVLSSRYVLALSLILMIFSAFALSYLYQNIANQQKNSLKRWLVIGVATLLPAGLINNMLPKKNGYNYIQQSISWLEENNTSKKTVFYDDSRARFYAEAPFIGTWTDNWTYVDNALKQNQLNQYDYLIISHSSKHPEREQVFKGFAPQFTEIKRFADSKNKKFMVIYKRMN